MEPVRSYIFVDCAICLSWKLFIEGIGTSDAQITTAPSPKRIKATTASVAVFAPSGMRHFPRRDTDETILALIVSRLLGSCQRSRHRKMRNADRYCVVFVVELDIFF